MPRGDRTGRMGFGPMSGRGLGYCAGYGVPGYMNRPRGFGMGMGRGYGYGLGYGREFLPPHYYNPQPVEERELLQRHKDALEEELKSISERLALLEKGEK